MCVFIYIQYLYNYICFDSMFCLSSSRMRSYGFPFLVLYVWGTGRGHEEWHCLVLFFLVFCLVLFSRPKNPPEKPTGFSPTSGVDTSRWGVEQGVTLAFAQLRHRTTCQLPAIHPAFPASSNQAAAPEHHRAVADTKLG